MTSQDRVTAVPCKGVRKGQVAPSKATGREQNSSPGEQQLVAYTGRVRLSATQTGSQTEVQVDQSGLILSLNHFFWRKDWTFSINPSLNMVWAGIPLAVGEPLAQPALAQSEMHSQHERDRLFLEVKGYLFPTEFMHWSSLGVIHSSVFCSLLHFSHCKFASS